MWCRRVELLSTWGDDEIIQEIERGLFFFRSVFSRIDSVMSVTAKQSISIILSLRCTTHLTKLNLS